MFKITLMISFSWRKLNQSTNSKSENASNWRSKESNSNSSKRSYNSHSKRSVPLYLNDLCWNNNNKNNKESYNKYKFATPSKWFSKLSKETACDKIIGNFKRSILSKLPKKSFCNQRNDVMNKVKSIMSYACSDSMQFKSSTSINNKYTFWPSISTFNLSKPSPSNICFK